MADEVEQITDGRGPGAPPAWMLSDPGIPVGPAPGVPPPEPGYSYPPGETPVRGQALNPMAPLGQAPTPPTGVPAPPNTPTPATGVPPAAAPATTTPATTAAITEAAPVTDWTPPSREEWEAIQEERARYQSYAPILQDVDRVGGPDAYAQMIAQQTQQQQESQLQQELASYVQQGLMTEEAAQNLFAPLVRMALQLQPVAQQQQQQVAQVAAEQEVTRLSALYPHMDTETVREAALAKRNAEEVAKRTHTKVATLVQNQTGRVLAANAAAPAVNPGNAKSGQGVVEAVPDWRDTKAWDAYVARITGDPTSNHRLRQ